MPRYTSDETLTPYGAYRQQLEDEYVTHRQQMGDWDEEEEAMSNAQRGAHFRAYAQTLTLQQLVSACNSYAMAD